MSQYLSSEADSDSGTPWIEWFQSQRGNEFFCLVDEDYILDRFNLAGLGQEVRHFQLAFEVITDTLQQNLNASTWEDVDRSARHLYGLIHARWILTNRGLAMMAEKFRRKEFGRCPRVLCEEQPVLPVGISDIPGKIGVKLYCPKCEDIYNPVSKKHNLIDGAYFTTTLPHLLLQIYPTLAPTKKDVRYEPKIFGFRIHSLANERRFQDLVREEMKKTIDIKKRIKMEE